jgi:hypothetical protein
MSRLTDDALIFLPSTLESISLAATRIGDAGDGCVCVCVCVRERERERDRDSLYITWIHTHHRSENACGAMSKDTLAGLRERETHSLYYIYIRTHTTGVRTLVARCPRTHSLDLGANLISDVGAVTLADLHHLRQQT